MIEKNKPKFFYGYIIVALAFLLMAVFWGTLYSFGVFFKPVLTEFGWTRAVTSGAFSLCFILYGFSAMLAGRMNDRFGPRLVVTVTGLLCGLGYLLMSRIDAIWQLYLYYGVILAMGTSGSYVPLSSMISRWFTRRRGVMMGIAVSGIGVGTLVMSPIANWLISSYGWRTSYIVVGITALVLIVSAAQFLKRDPAEMGLSPYGEKEGKEPGGKIKGLPLGSVIATWNFWMVCLAFFCFGVAIQAILVHIVAHVTDIGISATTAASVLAIIGGGGFAGRFVVGGVTDKIGSRMALLFSFAGLVVALFWLLFCRQAWMFFPFAVVFGLAYGAFSTLIGLVVAEFFGVAALGVILGAALLGTALGEAFGALLPGYVFDVTGSYQLAFIICAVLSVVGIGLSLLLKPVVPASSPQSSSQRRS